MAGYTDQQLAVSIPPHWRRDHEASVNNRQQQQQQRCHRAQDKPQCPSEKKLN